MSNIVIKDNLVEHNSQTNGAETGIWVKAASNVVVENNISRYNCTGLRIEGSNQVLARWNRIYGNSSLPLLAGIPTCLITVGVPVEYGYKVLLSDGSYGSDAIIVHNTVHGNGLR